MDLTSTSAGAHEPTAARTPPDDRELGLIARVFADCLREDDLFGLLEYLNGLTDHRFTGVYRFEPGWVVSVALFDREHPDLRIGADVKMKESYCWLTGLSDCPYVIEDAVADPRLGGHAARDEVRSYVAVLLKDIAGRPWGTLCHFDFAPRPAPPHVLAHLQALQPLVEETFVRDKRARWDPDADSKPRRPLV